MILKLPSDTVFHVIESTIKSYRRFAQQNIDLELTGVTVDQGLVLIFLDKYPEMTQNEIAQLVFKDNASMTRMINTMVSKNYLKRSMNTEDRRRFSIQLTPEGKEILKKLPKIIQKNRQTSLQGISDKELTQLENTLKKIQANCQNT